ncbi:amino acid/amide ABC transporter membrane protein 1, HAAT family [Acidothermus cellulolyticus 11B]|uniref:Amino acid/amide ABC transporter membrane protein 1, HAAT family n=1 Tax=Acidothermus cellulolyticus (strain ATCC 43068 / DSM 8971 / 11B) TaxID=351607 RepID=A0LTC0_ACIC1|nr:branched-chain amino acid ABC transporter permease [Acidothermus cellulolyticus]ABK52680.1 amino acid/amide ABC transporter membrane protein 1, HAAT family [Acidothermus cellulolyticus 11B]MCL6551296.1 branched-chain amino acid ABC transporter permease [Acidothermus cellulolyticus]
MHDIIEAVILGVLTGGVYALMASGQTLIFGVMRVINLAQGALVVVAAFLAYTLFGRFHIDPFLAILITTPILFLIGVAIQWLFLRPLRADDLAEMSLLVTFAVALGLEGILTLVYKTDYRSIKPVYANDSFVVLGYRITTVRLYAFLLSLAALGVLYLVLYRTRLGRALRATVQNPTAAQLLGVEAKRVSAMGFGLGAATAAAAGSVFGVVYPFNPNSHYDLISRLLSIVILGGLGSVGGAVLGAVVMGVVSSVVAVVASPTWADFSFFVVLIAVLLVRPQGFFGMRLRGAA